MSTMKNPRRVSSESRYEKKSVGDLPIVLSADAGYFAHLGTCIYSVLVNCEEPARLKFYILDGGISGENQSFLSSLVSDFSAEIAFITGLSRAYEDVPVKESVGTLPAFFRLSIAEVLPIDTRFAVYLDCDLVVEEDIFGVLAHCKGDKAALWAVEDASQSVSYALLQIPSNKFFNSGVMVLNLDFWRTHNTGQKVRKFKIENDAYIVGNEQGALNGVLWSHWEQLPPKWNQQSGIYRSTLRKKGVLNHTRAEMLEAMYRPAVVHFVGSRKPWKSGCPHPLKSRYWEYRRSLFGSDDSAEVTRKLWGAFFKKPHHFIRGYWHYLRYLLHTRLGQ